MKTTDYQISFATEETAANVLSKIRRVSDWWTRHIDGSAEQVNDQFTVKFGESFVHFLVAENVPDKRIVWHVTDCDLHWFKDRKEWKGTDVVWQLSSDAGNTTVTMTHVGLNPEVECYQACERGWDFYVGESLQRLVTEGVGLPDLQSVRQAAAQ